MRKNLQGRILKYEPKEQHLSTVPKSCSYFNNNHTFEKNPHYFNEAKVGTINFIHILKNLN